MPLHISRRALFGVGVAAVAAPMSVAGQAAVGGGGLVVLTVGGAIGAPNRKPFDAARDHFFQHNNLSFDKARAFSVADLAGLPQQTVKHQGKAGETVYTGPFLSDILNAAKPLPQARSARLFALDGYGVEFAMADIRPQGWVLAMQANGVAFGIGDFGPLYTVRQLDGQGGGDEEAAKWIFSVYYIEVGA